MPRWLMPRTDIDEIEAIFARDVNIELYAGRETVEATPMTVIPGGTAVITVEGPLMNERSDLLDFFGVKHTAYQDIIKQTNEAAERAKRIRYDIDSPGGRIDGLYGAMEAIRKSPLPTRTVARNNLTSAAYMLASQTGRIESADEITAVGSVGVAADYLAMPGVKSFANPESPKKRPDLETEEGKAVIGEELSDFYTVLAGKVAEGRGITVAEVNERYGQGAVMTARTALSKGLIDGIQKPASQPADKKKESRMNKAELREQHAALYAEVFEEGKSEGVAEERSRVKAHFDLADGSGDVDAARAAIDSGEKITQATMAHHASAFMKRKMVADRAADDPPAIGRGSEDRNQASDDAKAKAEYEAAHQGVMVE